MELITWLVESRISMSDGLALVAIQRRVWVSSSARLFFSWVILPWLVWFSMNLFPKITAKGVISKREPKLMTCDVFRDSLDEIKKTRERIRAVINA